MEFAETIIEQLGGIGKLKSMINAKYFGYSEKDISLTFKFTKGKNGINSINIKLNSNDTYDLTFYKISGTNAKTIKEINDIYCDQLKEIFEQTTGLYLSLF